MNNNVGSIGKYCIIFYKYRYTAENIISSYVKYKVFAGLIYIM